MLPARSWAYQSCGTTGCWGPGELRFVVYDRRYTTDGALIRELADYEKLAHEVRFTEDMLEAYLFGIHPMAEVVIGEAAGTAQGFALFFHNFSTFEGRPGIYLEDLFVAEAARGKGTGRALINDLQSIAKAQGWQRLYWHTDEGNTRARGLYDSFVKSDGHIRYRMKL